MARFYGFGVRRCVDAFVTEEVELNGKFTWKKFYMFCIRFVVPPVMLLVLLGQLDSFFKLGIFG